MAKSGRSKIKRAHRALKREKNAKKEAAKLEKMVEQAKETLASQSEKKVYTVLGATTAEPAVKPEESMMVDGEEPEKTVTTKSEDVEGNTTASLIIPCCLRVCVMLCIGSYFMSCVTLFYELWCIEML